MSAARRAAIALLYACALPGAAIAAEDSGAKLEAADACAQVVGDAERLDCFDNLFHARRDAEPAAPRAAVPAAAPVTAAAPAAAAEADFGLTEVQKEAANPRPAAESQPSNMTSRVTHVVARGMEPPMLELENSQQWLLLESAARLRFQDGDPVVIRRSAWGSYLASHPDRSGAWRVRRIR